MTIYLQDIPLEKAIQVFEDALNDAGLGGVIGREIIALDEKGMGRTLSEPVWAKICSPHYHASAMDGFAIHAEDSQFAAPTRPVDLRVGEKAQYLDTGDPLPSWADAVVPIEEVEPLDLSGQYAENIRAPHIIRLRAALTPWMHVRPMGEDLVASQLVLVSGTVLSAYELGAAAASGNDRLVVSRRPRVAILPTGNELVAFGNELKPGDIPEYNSILLAAQIESWGAEAVRCPIHPDDFQSLCETVSELANQYDLVLINAGSSAGSEDYTSRVIKALGKVLVHGVAVRPGHPVILGLLNCVNEGCVPVIGVPGFPVSAALTLEIFVRPIIFRWLGRKPDKPKETMAVLTRKVVSPAGDDDFLRVILGKVGERVIAAPLPRASGAITSLSRADGITIIPRGVQGLEAGARVNVRLLRESVDIEATIFMIGSHDLTLDLLAEFLAPVNRRLVSSNTGSQGGLIAIQRGEAHLTGCHLFDPLTGQYNLPFLKQYLPNTPVRVIGWVRREQGLMVAKGNPQGIQSLGDLARNDLRFVNRQKGSGTRLLLDYHLGLLGLSPKQIHGYRQEEYTHLGVAVAVASGRAEVGLGIRAAAQVLDLDFIPVDTEQYDLVIPDRYFSDAHLAPILELTQDRRFRSEISKLPGYDITPMGTIRQ